MSTLESQLKAHADYCNEQISKLTLSLEKFPPGRLRHYQNGKYIRYVILIPGQNPVFLHSGDKDLIKRMARKLIFEARLKDMTAELEICTNSLNTYNIHPHALEQLLADPLISGLLSAENPETDLQAWMDEPYIRCTSHSDHLIVPTAAGFPVRSKAESIIIIVLLELKIPFRYEQEHIFNGISYFPDFTLLHPLTRQTAILEHFGLMDDSEYCSQAYRKMCVYTDNGFRPQERLICFFEYKTKPLDINRVRYELVQWLQ